MTITKRAVCLSFVIVTYTQFPGDGINKPKRLFVVTI